MRLMREIDEVDEGLCRDTPRAMSPMWCAITRKQVFRYMSQRPLAYVCVSAWACDHVCCELVMPMQLSIAMHGYGYMFP